MSIRRIHLLIIIAAFITLFAGVQTATSQVHIVHIAYTSHGQPWIDFLEAMAERFNALHHPNITVEIMPGGGSTYRDKVVSMITGGISPDVTDFSEATMAALIEEGVFLDLRQFIQRDSEFDLGAYIPVVFQSVTAPDGAIIGLPFDIYPTLPFYNIDILNEVGLPTPNDLRPEEWTWDQVVEMAKKATKIGPDGSVERYGIGQATYRWWNHVVQAGGKMYDRYMLGSVSYWNTPEVLAGIDWVRALMLDYQVAPIDGTPGANQYNFNHGRSAMTLGWGPGMVGQWLKDVTFNWDVALQPLGPANRGAQVAVNSVQILSTSQHPEEAWEWVKFLSYNLNNALEYIRITGRMPALLAAQAYFPELAGDLAPRHWLRYYETAVDPNAFATFIPRMASAVNSVVNAELRTVWRGEQAPAVALQRIHEQVSAIFAEAKQQ